MDGVEFQRRIRRIAEDRRSGASDLLQSAVGIVDDAIRGGLPLTLLARALCHAQPSMGGFWTLAMEALAAERAPGRFQRFRQRLARAPHALERFVTECLASSSPRPLHVVTLSSSSAVVTALQALARRCTLHVSCSDSRPGLEGRALATRLAATGIPVTMFADAAIAHALAPADAVLVGADALAPQWFLNKSGTQMLAAAAAHRGIPVYVAATREKFVGATIAQRLQIGGGDATEIWDAPPPGVEIRNPYFEATPLELVSAVITDIGVLGAALVPDVCEASADPASVQALIDLLDGGA
jgi:translation initiation factor 2B subunit (eIF-2B alpha/beta/delta family)